MNGRDLALVLIAGGIMILVGLFLFRPWGALGGWVRMPMMGYGMAFGMFLFPLILLVLLVAIAPGTRWYHEMRVSERSGALEIIRERYARGEISKEQYEQLKKDLEY